MLLRFTVENHRSFRDPQELSLVATALRDEASMLIEVGPPLSEKVLPTAVIYGPNASGKSNLLDAISWMRKMVLSSHSRGKPGARVSRKRFLLDESCATKPSTYDIDFVIDSVRYNFGFKVDDSSFVEEWLYFFPFGRQQTLYERNDGNYYFGRGLRGKNKTISELTRPNSLFLSAAAQNDHSQLQRIVDFFAGINQVQSSLFGPMVLIGSDDADFEPRVIEFLKELKIGVIGFRLEKEKFDDKAQKLMENIVSFFSDAASEKSEINYDEHLSLRLGHANSSGTEVYFDPKDESAGTWKIVHLMAPIFRALDRGECLLIDEIDTSLHTMACEAIVSLFLDKRINKNGAQLIVTTHDTNLLSSELLRRDEIWFVEKEALGSSVLYPLSDIKVRKEDNWEKGYLQGRFGAVPFSGSKRILVDLE